MKKNKYMGNNGSILVMTLVLLVVACMILGALAVLTSTNSGNLRITTARERAFYLADAGLNLAMNQMTRGLYDPITRAGSQAFFSSTTNMYGAGNWGFSTSISNVPAGSNTPPGRRVESVGFFDGIAHTAAVTCVDVAAPAGLNFIYRLGVYIGGSAGMTTFTVGGTGTQADFTPDDIYVNGNIVVTGDARLPNGEMDANNDGLREPDETWKDAYAATPLGPMTQAQFDAYLATVAPYTNLFFKDSKYTPGEAFVDNIGNGVYDMGELFTDANGDGVWNSGNTQFIPGNGVYDVGEAYTPDTVRYGRNNGVWDKAGAYWKNGKWNTSYKVSGKTYQCTGWPAEPFVDEGNEIYTPPETFVDQNGVYDVGETYLDDRNGVFDWGTMASGTITGMAPVDESLGVRNADGGDPVVPLPNLSKMYYDYPKTGSTPPYASRGWGHDIAVTATDYSANGVAITDGNTPEHIFIRNPSTSANKTVGSVTIKPRSYTAIYYTNSVNVKTRIDDYFLEDPTDSSYNNPSSSGEIGNAGSSTYPMYVNVKTNGNNKVYYVDGNMYIHSPVALSLRFKEPGTIVTIIVNGNITISDEFYYNADYDPNLTYADMNSTVVHNAKDGLCLIAKKNPNVPNDSGNIKIGDAAYGTGGSIHAMMYAENDIIDNNKLDPSKQPFISVYGNMAAGRNVDIHRDVNAWTRLDVTLDKRLKKGDIFVAGLPPALPGANNFIFEGLDTPGVIGQPVWKPVPGTWKSSSVMCP